MAIFIPAGGSLMVRGGPIFWSRPIRQEHAAGPVSFVGDSSFPSGANEFFVEAARAHRTSGGVDCVSLFSQQGGRIVFPLILYFEFWGTPTLFHVNIRVQCIVNSILRLTSSWYTENVNVSTSGTGVRGILWDTSLSLSDIAPNARILFRVEYTLNHSVHCRGGLRILRPTSSMVGIIGSWGHASVSTGTINPFSSHSVPSSADVSTAERPAPPIRTVSPMPPIAQRGVGPYLPI